MANNEVTTGRFTKKDFRGVFWRSFTLLGSFNYERMEGLGFLYAIMPLLRKIYKDDDEGLKAAMHRNIAAFNMTVAPSPFVMGTTIAMEESAKEDPNFDVSTINAIKVSLMGPLSGIGDTFFWGIIRILACALAIGFAKEGNPIAPFILLLVFNIPNVLTRLITLDLGYNKGAQILSEMEKTGRMALFTHCAGIIGAMSMEYAKKNGYLTLAITGNLQSKITENTDISVHLLVGDELTPPETKGYTVSVLSVYLWAIGVAKAKNIYTEEQYQEALKEAADLVNHFQTVLDESEAWYDRNNASIVNSERIYVLGYGVDYGSMLEGVLKAGEMLRLPVLGYELEEYSHGPTMAIGPKQTILMIGSDEAEYERMLQFRTAYKKYTPRVHVIKCKFNCLVRDHYGTNLVLSDLS